MPDNGSIQKRDAHEMAHGRPVQITEHTTVTELQPSLSDVVCANKKLQIGIIIALVVTGAPFGLCRSSALCRHQDLGLHHRGYRPKEGQRVGAYDVVRCAVCGYHCVAGRYGNAGGRAARTAFGKPGHRARRALPRKTLAYYIVVGWPGHLNPVLRWYSLRCRSAFTGAGARAPSCAAWRRACWWSP